MATENVLSYFLNDFKSTSVNWNSLPDIYLYMDQILTYLDVQLKPFKVNEKEKLLTSSMINNYVKDHVIPKPENKKYNKNHLAKLIEICALKQTLNVLEIKHLFEISEANQNDETQYHVFSESQRNAFEGVSKRVSETVTNLDSAKAKEELLKLLMELINESNARRIASVKILEYLRNTNTAT